MRVIEDVEGFGAKLQPAIPIQPSRVEGMKKFGWMIVCLLVLLPLGSRAVWGQTVSKPQLVVLDTDIGDDIDDAFALALLLKSPDVKLLGITTEYGDTELRARLVDRYLAAVGRTDIPVAAGVVSKATNVFTQRAYAVREPDRKHLDGVRFLLREARKYPGQVTLIAIGPLDNVGAAIARDPAGFRKFKRVVMMGGSVYRGYGPEGTRPQVEWNAGRDPAGLQALLRSGVPVFMMPLDSTQIALPEKDQDRIFSYGSPVTDQVTLLFHQWKARNEWHGSSPTLYDPVAASYALEPGLCPMQALRLIVDEKGMTRPVAGAPNVNVCVKSDEAGFLAFLLGRIAPDGVQAGR